MLTRADHDQTGLTLAQHVAELLQIFVVHAALHVARDGADRRAGTATDGQRSEQPDRREDRGLWKPVRAVATSTAPRFAAARGVDKAATPGQAACVPRARRTLADCGLRASAIRARSRARSNARRRNRRSLSPRCCSHLRWKIDQRSSAAAASRSRPAAARHRSKAHGSPPSGALQPWPAGQQQRMPVTYPRAAAYGARSAQPSVPSAWARHEARV